MLERIKDELKKTYYDPNFHGMDLDARFKTASNKIKEAASERSDRSSGSSPKC
jgi:hypothetical protein